MSVPRCITEEDYRKEARSLLTQMRISTDAGLKDDEIVQRLAAYLRSLWVEAEMYAREIDGSHGY